MFRGPIAKGWISAYLDDITISSSSVEEHLEHLNECFSILKQNNLTLRRDKCRFMVDVVPLLGHVVSPEGISPDPAKVKAMSEFARPQNIKQLQGFLGMLGYYSIYLDKYATARFPLNELVSSANTQFVKGGKRIHVARKKKPPDDKWKRCKNCTIHAEDDPSAPFGAPVWSPTCEKAFIALKSDMCKATTLAHPDPKQSYTIYTDASSVAIGGILQQDGRPVAYYIVES